MASFEVVVAQQGCETEATNILAIWFDKEQDDTVLDILSKLPNETRIGLLYNDNDLGTYLLPGNAIKQTIRLNPGKTSNFSMNNLKMQVDKRLPESPDGKGKANIVLLFPPKGKINFEDDGLNLKKMTYVFSPTLTSDLNNLASDDEHVFLTPLTYSSEEKFQAMFCLDSKRPCDTDRFKQVSTCLSCQMYACKNIHTVRNRAYCLTHCKYFLQSHSSPSPSAASTSPTPTKLLVETSELGDPKTLIGYVGLSFVVLIVLSVVIVCLIKRNQPRQENVERGVDLVGQGERSSMLEDNVVVSDDGYPVAMEGSGGGNEDTCRIADTPNNNVGIQEVVETNDAVFEEPLVNLRTVERLPVESAT